MIQDEPTIIRSKRRKRSVALYVQPDGSLEVRAPVRTSVRWITAFIRERQLWIEHRRQEIKRKQAVNPICFEADRKFPFLGNEITIVLHKKDEEEATRTFLDKDELKLHIYLSDSLSPDDKKEEIRTSLILWYKKQARAWLPDRVACWESKMNLKAGRVILSNTKHQWGSCNSKNEIRLNWRLVLADPELADYVIVHELCHIPHKNHGKLFWAMCRKTLSDADARRKRLKQWEVLYHPASFPPPSA